MQEFSVIDESFDNTLTSSYFISIQLSLDGFSFCTLDPIQNLFIQFKHYTFEKPDREFAKSINLLNSEPLLKHNYKKAFILFQTEKSTLIPNALFKKDLSKQLIDSVFANNQLKVNNTSISNKIKMADAQNVFSINEDIIILLKKKFLNITLLHSSTPFIEANLLEDQRRTEPNQILIHLHFNKGWFYTIVTKNRELLLSNTFDYKNQNEIVYYLYYIFDQLKLNPQTSSITIAGNILSNNAEYGFLKKYIANLEIEKPEKHFNFSPIFKNVSIAEFTNLFNAPICVS